MQIFNIHTLFETGFLRQTQILGNPRRGVPGLIPVSATTWWAWVREGKAPPPVKLSSGVTAWRVEDIRAFITALTTQAGDSTIPTRGQRLVSTRRQRRKGEGPGAQGGDEPPKDGQ
jgi:prophage regulatory protein